MERALTAEQVKKARRRVRNGAKIGDVAKEVGVHYQIMYNAVRGFTYRGAGDLEPLEEPEPLTPRKRKRNRRRRQRSPRVAAAAAEGRRPCVECELLTMHKSGYCRFCRAEGRT